MKKILMLTAIAVGMMCNANAQENSWGVRGGVNIQKLNEKMDGGEEDDYKSNVGFHLGVIYDLGITENFYIQPGLYFATRGANVDVDVDVKFNLNYLQLPILASYRVDLGGDTKLHINAGPYLAFGVGGKLKGEDSGVSVEVDAFGDGDNQYGLKRFDAGLSFGTGMSFGKIYAGLSCDLGLANIADEDEFVDGYTLKNRNFSISVGYNF